MLVARMTKKMIDFYEGNTRSVEHFLKVLSYASLIGKLEGVDDINAAMSYKTKVVHISRADAKLPKGAFFIQDIIGATVIDEQRGEIGKLVDVMETPASNIYVVRGETEHLIPVAPEFIMSTDADKGIINVRLIEGM